MSNNFNYYYSNIKEDKNEEASVLTINNLFNYWQTKLLGVCMTIFEYTNMPKWIPIKEIEMRLLINGYCAIVNDPVAGEIVVTGGMSGPTPYFDLYKKMTYGTAEARGGTVPIYNTFPFNNTKNKNMAVIIYNDSLMTGIHTLINRYASLLTHADLTLKNALINNRITDVFLASDDYTAESAKEFYNDVYVGKSKVIVDDDIGLDNISGLKNIANDRKSGILTETLEVSNNILKNFFTDLGIRTQKDKREREITEEVVSDTQHLLINVRDMLRNRKEGMKAYNELTNREVSVELSPEFDFIVKKENVNSSSTNIDSSLNINRGQEG